MVSKFLLCFHFPQVTDKLCEFNASSDLNVLRNFGKMFFIDLSDYMLDFGPLYGYPTYISLKRDK